MFEGSLSKIGLKELTSFKAKLSLEFQAQCDIGKF